MATAAMAAAKRIRMDQLLIYYYCSADPTYRRIAGLRERETTFRSSAGYVRVKS
jgi:hypothetical protein